MIIRWFFSIPYPPSAVVNFVPPALSVFGAVSSRILTIVGLVISFIRFTKATNYDVLCVPYQINRHQLYFYLRRCVGELYRVARLLISNN